MNTCELCDVTYIEMNEEQHERDIRREFKITMNALVFRLCGRGPFYVKMEVPLVLEPMDYDF